MKKYLVRVEHHRTYFQNVEIEAENAGEACELAINEADDEGVWTSYNEMGPSYIGGIESDNAPEADAAGGVDIPHKFTEGVVLGFVAEKDCE